MIKVNKLFSIFFFAVFSKRNTVKPPVATTSRKQPPLLIDQFSKIPKVSKSNHYENNYLEPLVSDHLS